MYLDAEQRTTMPKPRFGNTQHASVSTASNITDSDIHLKPSPQSKRLAYGDNFTHFPTI